MSRLQQRINYLQFKLLRTLLDLRLISLMSSSSSCFNSKTSTKISQNHLYLTSKLVRDYCNTTQNNKFSINNKDSQTNSLKQAHMGQMHVCITVAVANMWCAKNCNGLEKFEISVNQASDNNLNTRLPNLPSK